MAKLRLCFFCSAFSARDAQFMFRFAAAAFTPLILLLLGAMFGDIWPLLGLLSITAMVFVLDRIVPPQSAFKDDTSETLSLALGFWHFVLLAVGVYAIGAGDHLSSTNKAILIFGIALYFGQVSNANAHELIHSANTRARNLGIMVYSSLLFGHHVSAHTRVHHVFASTEKDPNSAPLGMSFYKYFARAWTGSFIQGYRRETALRRRLDVPPPWYSHPYVSYGVGAAITLLGSWIIAGVMGVITMVAIAIYAQAQLLLSDYVQHYGLRRRTMANGKPEPLGANHAWNAPQGWSSAMMLNATRHSHHHMKPKDAFTALEVSEDMPMLPYSLPVMCSIALYPKKWHEIMDTEVVLRTRMQSKEPMPVPAKVAQAVAGLSSEPKAAPTAPASAPAPEAPAAQAEPRAEPPAAPEKAQETGPSPYDLAMSFYEEAPESDSPAAGSQRQRNAKRSGKRWRVLERLGV
jgi:alkane 1-monooxygenase